MEKLDVIKRLAPLMITLILPLFSQAQDDNSLLYRVEKEGAVNYVFGTYHLAGSDFLDTLPRVKEEFESAEKVVVETVLDSSQLLSLAPLMLMRDTGLSELLDSIEYQKLKDIVRRELSLDLQMFENVKPMVLSGMLTIEMIGEYNPSEIARSGMPLDVYFYHHAQRQQREVISLESNREQMQLLFNGQSAARQAQELYELASRWEESGEWSRELLEAYAAGDLDKMWELSEQDDFEFQDMDYLLTDRNKRWIGKLLPHLQQGRTFVAVGALHLPGPQGVLKLLEAEGYRVVAVNAW